MATVLAEMKAFLGRQSWTGCKTDSKGWQRIVNLINSNDNMLQNRLSTHVTMYPEPRTVRERCQLQDLRPMHESEKMLAMQDECGSFQECKPRVGYSNHQSCRSLLSKSPTVETPI